MTDFAIHIDGDSAAIALFGGQLVLDESLRPAVLLSLLCDAEVPELFEGERRGWWGDALSDVPGDRVGSTQWTLQREKLGPETPMRVRLAYERALAWLVADGIASTVTVTATRRDNEGVDIAIQIARINGQRELMRFGVAWAATLGRPVLRQNQDTVEGFAGITALLEFEFTNHYAGIQL